MHRSRRPAPSPRPRAARWTAGAAAEPAPGITRVKGWRLAFPVSQRESPTQRYPSALGSWPILVSAINVPLAGQHRSTSGVSGHRNPQVGTSGRAVSYTFQAGHASTQIAVIRKMSGMIFSTAAGDGPIRPARSAAQIRQIAAAASGAVCVGSKPTGGAHLEQHQYGAELAKSPDAPVIASATMRQQTP